VKTIGVLSYLFYRMFYFQFSRFLKTVADSGHTADADATEFDSFVSSSAAVWLGHKSSSRVSRCDQRLLHGGTRHVCTDWQVGLRATMTSEMTSSSSSSTSSPTTASSSASAGRTYYVVLGVNNAATCDEAKKAWVVAQLYRPPAVCVAKNTHTHRYRHRRTPPTPPPDTCTRAHTRTHPFNGHLSRTTRVSRYQKGKTNLDFTEAGASEWQWHQLGRMQVCTSLQTDNQHPNTQFFTVRMPFLTPNSVKALKLLRI